MSTTTTNKGYIKQAHNEDVDAWDVPLNTTFDIIDKNLGGVLTVPVSNAPVTLNATQAQNLIYIATGVMSGNVTITYPAVGGIFSVFNSTTGAFTLTIACAGGGGTVVVPQGQSSMLLSTGTSLYQPNPLVGPTMLTTGGPSWNSSGDLSLPAQGRLTITSLTPTIIFNDTNSVVRYLYADGGLIGNLKSDGNWGSYTDNSGNFVAAGNVSAFSDERTKSGFEDIKDAMAILRQFKGTFYTDIATGERRVGWVAQQVKDALPEVVGVGADDMLHLAYGNVGAVIAEATKQLDERIERLENLVGLLA